MHKLMIMVGGGDSAQESIADRLFMLVVSSLKPYFCLLSIPRFIEASYCSANGDVIAGKRQLTKEVRVGAIPPEF
jgi:hypothetical protein